MRQKTALTVLVVGGGVLLAAGLFAGMARVWAWDAAMYSLRAQFPSVPTVSVEELGAALAGPRPPLLLDARGVDEFRVSHLRSASRATDAAAAYALLAGKARDIPVVVYCSLGYRSAKLVEALQQAGYTGARSLEGGIFAWANRGRPVFRGDRPVDVVHPFRLPWALFLDSSLRSAGAAD
jgi:rhodanese-related sulfurtransferase